VKQATTHPRIVLCTSIAEQAVTIPDAVVVVDLGLSRKPAGDGFISTLRTSRASLAESHQRAGRVGRTAPGAYILVGEPLQEVPAGICQESAAALSILCPDVAADPQFLCDVTPASLAFLRRRTLALFDDDAARALASFTELPCSVRDAAALWHARGKAFVATRCFRHCMHSQQLLVFEFFVGGSDKVVIQEPAPSSTLRASQPRGSAEPVVC